MFFIIYLQISWMYRDLLDVRHCVDAWYLQTKLDRVDGSSLMEVFAAADHIRRLCGECCLVQSPPPLNFT